MSKVRPVALIILDGFGYNKDKQYNAIAHAKTPHLDQWFHHYPHALLQASGSAVGLPDGSIGNSEVGHITIGAGRIIKQPIALMNDAIADKSFFSSKILRNALKKLQSSGKALHLIGLFSDANVHSNQHHAYAFIQAAKEAGIRSIFIHAFLDGRDTAPKSASSYLNQLDHFLVQEQIGIIASLHGRFYAMDRNKNWNRTQKSYDVLTKKQNARFSSWQEALNYWYTQNITDEFIPPCQLDSFTPIKDGDGIIFFNVRPDRAQQLTDALTNPNFHEFAIKKLSLTFFISPTNYHNTRATIELFPHTPAHHTLKEVLSAHKKRIFSIAETEKYAHVTYFFADGRDSIFPYETQILIPSLKEISYSAHPQMSALAITNTVLESLKQDPYDFYLINYANADMVGHSGNFSATITAVEFLDQQLAKLYEQIVKKMNGIMIITADHGKAEEMFDSVAKQPLTRHTLNTVPFLLLDQSLYNGEQTLNLHELADIAPFILKIMDIPVPEEMES